jgi:hypothetical protein
MWRLSTENDTPLVIELGLERLPAIYLDHDALMGVAKVPELRHRFLAAFARGGTLLFSWAGALEVSGPQGADAATVESFLSDIGEHWLPMEMNVFRIARREAGHEPHDGHPCLSASFVIGYFMERLYEVSPGGSRVVSVGPSLCDLGRVAAWIQRDREDVRQDMQRYKAEVERLVSSWRAGVAADKEQLNRLLPPLPLAGGQPATALLHALLRPVIASPQNERWEANDALDLSRAVVAGTCADLIALDKTWKRRLLATGITTARQGVKIFYRPEVELLVRELERSV